VNYVRAAAAAEEVVREICGSGGRAVAIHADVGDLSQHERLISGAVNHFGHLEILVNNAGFAIRQSFLDATPQVWDDILGVNLKGVYFLTQAVARVMKETGGGKVVNISSVHDTRPMRGNSIYCVSKGGLIMLTKVLALELAECGIQVNAVSPGAILTDETRGRLADPAYLSRVLERIPSKRIGDVEDIVGAVVLLASHEADYITGSTLYVDGGMLLH
jgi:NAD(P)-dependent dehydrogenase (short-subunit alcohol dehydrogenase family)